MPKHRLPVTRRTFIGGASATALAGLTPLRHALAQGAPLKVGVKIGRAHV